MSFEQYETEDRRLVTLRLLSEAQGYDQNSNVLRSALERFGHRVSRDKLHTDLAWLAEQGLVTTHEVHTVVVATLTARGADVASGVAHVPGVKRPGPGD